MRTKSGTLTAKQFDESVALLPRLSPENKKLARKVLVEGMVPNQLALEEGVSRQTLSVVCARVLAKFHATSGRPLNWVKVDLFAPPDLAKEFHKAVNKAIKAMLKK